MYLNWSLLASGMCRCFSGLETYQLDSVYHVIMYNYGSRCGSTMAAVVSELWCFMHPVWVVDLSANIEILVIVSVI